MARRSQCSSAGDNPLDPNYLPPHYREEYRLAVDALIEEDLEGYYQFLQKADVVDFLSAPEIQHIQSSVQVPQQSFSADQHFPEIGGDGSSDTYWPIHSDLDAPGLDLGWPQPHPFIGPTEVTTLVNPPEPDMPSIKEQARRLIKNAQQVVAIAMDMFTDVDIFSDILDAAMRNVAVYIILDKQNVHHFVNMVSNCRVNLQSIQLLRVRTVSGITYHCRSGKSFQGQMMDRFLLTDCRAVLSGNYSFMWSYEKLHRCMAHLFLGQLVKTFDEEFRILFAQSHPLIVENFAPADEFSILQKRPYPGERILFREQRKFQTPDGAYLEEWPRQSYDDRVDTDWRAMALKKQEARHAPTDLYGRFTPQQTRMDPPFDPGPSRVPMMENLAFKRHSYAEGSPGRYSYPFLQQGQPEPENQGRLFHRGQQPGPGPGKELDYGGNDKFWNQDFYSPDQYSESGLPQEMQPPDNFDPVLNYLSSTRNVDFDQGSEKSLPATLEQPHASNLTDQKQLLQEPNADRKDPMVKRGLRNWRISSYLSAYDNPGEEGLPSAPPNAADPFEEPSNPLQQTPGIDLSVPKIPNVREFKVPAIPRPSHMPSYIKTTTRELPKKLPDEPAAAETASTPSESSSSTEVEKMEEAEQKELKTSGLRREESFRRKHNAAVQRSSRLRSSLIFSSLEQQHTPQDTKTALDGQDEESEKNESGQTKLPFASHVLGQRRSTPREPFEWSRYVKSATFDNSATDPSKPDDGTGKQDDKDSAKISEVQESLKPPDEAKLPKTDRAEQPPESLHTTPLFVDMNDPDMRLVFFKELAAKRRAAKAAEAEKSKEKALVQPPAELKDNAAGKKEEPVLKETSANISDTSEVLLAKNAGAEDAEKTVSTVSLTSDASDQKSKHASQVKTDPDASQSRRQEQTKDSAESAESAESAKAELKNSQSVASLRVSAETGAPQSKPPEQPKPTSPAVKSPHTPPASAPPVAQGSESPRIDSTSKESGSLTPSSAEVTPSPSSASAAKIPESLQSGTSISSPPPLPEQHTRSESGSSKPSVQSPSADHIRPDSGSQISSPSSSAPLSSPEETKSPKVTLEDSSSTITLSTSPPNAQECVLPSTPEHSTSSETLSAAHSAGSEPDKSSSQSSMKKDIPASENISVPANGERSEDIKAVSPSLPEPCLPKASDLEGKSAQNETITPTPLAPEAPPKHSETSSPVQPDSTPAAPQSERQATPPSQLNLTGSVTPAKTVSSPPTESVGSVLSPEAEKTLQSPSDTKQSPTNTTNTPPLPSGPAQPTSTVPTEPTSTVPTGPTSTAPKEPTPTVPTEPTSTVPTEPTSTVPTGPTSTVPTEATSTVPKEPTSTVPTGPTSKVPTEPISTVPTEPISTVPKEPTSTVPKEPTSTVPTEPTSTVPKEPTSTVPMEPTSTVPTEPTSTVPTEPTSTVPTEPTSKVQAELDLACKTPKSVTSDPQPSELPVSAENGKTDSQHETQSERKHNDTEATNEANKPNEKTNERVEQNNCSDPPETPSDEVVPPSPQSKQPKSRYQSSTANVLSSSNLRDDTKLLLGQISANNQSRNEAAKELPVTDDEKEDEADKNAKREKQRGIGSLNRGEPKMTQEKEKLLERIQSMRKERKVYSRFEMAP